MDQVGAPGVNGIIPRLKGGPSRLDDGKAAGIMTPSFQNIDRKTLRKDFIRGYMMNATGGQTEYPGFAPNVPGFGSEWKKEVKSTIRRAGARLDCGRGDARAQGELRRAGSGVKDAWGIPVIKIHMTQSDNEYKLVEDFQQKAMEWFKKAGGEIMPGPATPAGFPGAEGSPTANPAPRQSASPAPGSAPKRRPLGHMIHEVGTARMGVDPKTSVLTPFLQTHDVRNLFVMDGSCYVSIGCVNPTLTMMALTVRACDHIVRRVTPAPPRLQRTPSGS